MDVLSCHPETFLVYTANDSDPEADEFYGTTATLAVCQTIGGLLEVGLRQDLSYRWMEICGMYNLAVPCCYVFHARYLNRVVPYRDSVPQPQFSVHPQRSIDTP